MAKKKEIEKVRKYVVCSDGMNFYVTEESFKDMLENYDSGNLKNEYSMVVCDEDGGNEAKLYFPINKITRLATILIPKE